MALVADVALPRFQPARATTERAQLWIASDSPPPRAQQWPVLVPIPDGWHEVTAAEAATILRRIPTEVTFLLAPEPTDPAAEVAALTSSSPSEARRRASRPPRAPRSARPPRRPRPARAERAGRTARGERPPRPSRPPRPARPPRTPRKARPRRPRAYQTKQKPGICKGPACTCWTPGGCIGAWYLEALPAFADSPCYRGPCFSYELCVSEKCQLHPGCLVNTILQFWQRQYRALAQNPLGVVAEAATGLVGAARFAHAVIRQTAAQLEVLPPVIEGVTEGCPPGTRWAVGLTGFSCQSPATHPIAATREQLIAVGILKA